MRIEKILKEHGSERSAHTDQGMQSLVNENKKMADILEGELRDSALIASVQRLQHHQIAGYGSAAALAGQLGLRRTKG